MVFGLQPRSIQRRRVSPVFVVAWLWSGILILLLFYLREYLTHPSWHTPVPYINFIEFWLRPTPLGLSLRHAVKVVNVSLVALLWLRFRSTRWWPKPARPPDQLLYLGTAILLLALEWACHDLVLLLPRYKLEQIYP